METTLPGRAENPPLAPPVAPVGPGASAAAAAASPAAKVTAPLFGGFRGGRKRKDGLAPGSPEAIEADREKDRVRKERQRSRQVEPPALPAAGGPPVWRVRLKRRLALWVMVQGLKGCRYWLGMQRCSRRSLSNLSPRLKI